MNGLLDKSRNDLIHNIEMQVVRSCLKGNNLIPNPWDYPMLKELRKQLIDASQGRNTIAFDRLGRPHIMYVIPCDNNARADRYTEVLGGEAVDYHESWDNILPCFIRNGKLTRYLFVQKYRPSKYHGVNQSIGFPDMPQIYGDNGFPVSYNGINEECDRVNRGTFAEGHELHEITWDEYAMLSLESIRNRFNPHGNDTFGHAFGNAHEEGKPCGAVVGGRFVHTLNGSGPTTWTHNNDALGVHDFIGSTNIILSGLRLHEGTIQIVDFRKTDGSLTSEALRNEWSCIEVGGRFVPQGSDNVYCIDYVSPWSADRITDHCISNRIENRATSCNVSATRANMIGMREGVPPCAILRYLGLLPYRNMDVLGCQYMNNAKGTTFIMLAGSDYDNSYSSGITYRASCGSLDETDNTFGALLTMHSDKLE